MTPGERNQSEKAGAREVPYSVLWPTGRLVTLEQYLKVKSKPCRIEGTALNNLHHNNPASGAEPREEQGRRQEIWKFPVRAL